MIACDNDTGDKFFAGINSTGDNDTADKFFVGINNTSEHLSLVTMTPAITLYPVSLIPVINKQKA